MTKLDSAMEQHISKQQDSGEMASEQAVVHHRPISKKEMLRRQYKELFGYKPCGMTETEMSRHIDAYSRPSPMPVVEAKTATATIGDAVRQKIR